MLVLKPAQFYTSTFFGTAGGPFLIIDQDHMNQTVGRSQRCGPTTRAQSIANPGILLRPLSATLRRVNQSTRVPGIAMAAPVPPPPP